LAQNPLNVAQVSMDENRELLNRLADGHIAQSIQNPDADVIEKILTLAPNPADAKVLALGIALVTGYLVEPK
jgi:hypothetical protein